MIGDILGRHGIGGKKNMGVTLEPKVNVAAPSGVGTASYPRICISQNTGFIRVNNPDTISIDLATGNQITRQTTFDTTAPIADHHDDYVYGMFYITGSYSIACYNKNFSQIWRNTTETATFLAMVCLTKDFVFMVNGAYELVKINRSTGATIAKVATGLTDMNYSTIGTDETETQVIIWRRASGLRVYSISNLALIKTSTLPGVSLGSSEYPSGCAIFKNNLHLVTLISTDNSAYHRVFNTNEATLGTTLLLDYKPSGSAPYGSDFTCGIVKALKKGVFVHGRNYSTILGEVKEFTISSQASTTLRQSAANNNKFFGYTFLGRLVTGNVQ